MALGVEIPSGPWGSMLAQRVLSPYGRLISMGFPLAPFNSSGFNCAFDSVLSSMEPCHAVKLAGNGYHLHSNLRFLAFVFAHVRRRDEVVGSVERPMLCLDTQGRDSDGEDE